MVDNAEKTPRCWLITGGCGFIGTSLIRYLKKQEPEARVRVLDNLSVGTREDLAGVAEVYELPSPGAGTWVPGAVELAQGDIRDFDSCLAASAGADVIVHLAANTGVAPSVEDPRLDMEANVVGIFNMLEAARQNRARRFVFASSGAPLGAVDPPVHEKLAPRPVSPYGASKLAGEGYCSAFYHSFGISAVALRFGNVYGPGSGHKESVVARFIKRALGGKPLTIYGDGGQTRDFVYIEDLLDALLLAAEKEVGGEVFQIATHTETTVGELAGLLKKELVRQVPGIEVSVTHEDPRTGDVLRNFADTTKAARILGWQSRWPLEKGLAATLEWFLSSWTPAQERVEN